MISTQESNSGDVYKRQDKNVAYSIEDCKIDKVEDGWYWVSFLEPGYTVRSYFITKQ